MKAFLIELAFFTMESESGCNTAGSVLNHRRMNVGIYICNKKRKNYMYLTYIRDTKTHTEAPNLQNLNKLTCVTLYCTRIKPQLCKTFLHISPGSSLVFMVASLPMNPSLTIHIHHHSINPPCRQIAYTFSATS